MNTRNRILDILLVMFLAILLWLVITSWDDVLDKLLFEILGLRPNNIWSSILVAVINTIIALTIFIWLGVDLIESFGIYFLQEQEYEKYKQEFENKMNHN